MTIVADAPVRIGYVMTHYPRHSQTFLFNEVATVADGATEIVPYSLNPPDPGDVELPAEVSERDRTFYVKAQSPARIARARQYSLWYPPCHTTLFRSRTGVGPIRAVPMDNQYTPTMLCDLRKPILQFH